jgi:diketogulonate reductase-like aldo/keto reductase
MEYKPLNDSVKIPVIGLGTWGIGGFLEKDPTNDEESIRAIRYAIELGYTHIDTAELYAAGHSEELIGEAIKHFDRSKLIITSKVLKTHLKYDDVISACKKSLKRLQVTYIDIYLIHAPNPEIPLAETMKAMDFLVEEKLVRFIGVSNFSVEQMKEAQKYSKNRIVVNQIPYNLITRNKDYIGPCTKMESEIIPYCQKNNIIVIAYRPIERGEILKPHLVLDGLCKKYDKTRAQIALNWLISKKNVIAISKSTVHEQLEENLGAIGWSLSDDDIELLDKTKFELTQH